MSSREHSESQARAVELAAAHLFHAALMERRPADRCLAALLRQHKEYGSRDRRLITEAVYALFRWWGWLRTLAPRAGRDAAAGADWSAPLLGALLLENLPYDDVAAQWSRRNGLSPGEFGDFARAEQLPEKAQAFWRLFGKNRDIGQPQVSDLIPSWAPQELTSPRPLSELISWLQRRPPLWLRLQGSDESTIINELIEAGFAPVRHASVVHAVQVGNPRVNLYTLPAYAEGRVEVQDLASQWVGSVCAPAAGQRWWDVCAGGGGKSLLLAQLMARKGTVVATDIREYKLQNLRKRARRAAFPNIRTRAWDGKALPSDRATFDGVLVDAPCTCSGTWRRNPAARWSLERAEIMEMARLQGELLRKSASGVKRAGVLVYATCSFFHRENEQGIQAFLAANPAFHLEPFPHPVTGLPTDGTLQIWPWDGDCDAMFIARLRRG